MQNGIHFISGLPRAGSTLLASLLRQNPRFCAGMTSPVGGLFNAMLAATSARTEGAVFLDDDKRCRLLRAVFDAYYADTHETQLVFDTNRLWTTKLAALAALFPKARMVCCVRNPAWAVDSIERLVRRNAFETSGIFGFDPGGTVYSRAEGLTGGAGMIGFAWQALREAIYGPFADRLLLLRFETLTTNPRGALAAIYNFLGEDLYPHDPDHIEPAYDMIEFDHRLGTPGLHNVRSSVRPETRPTILPPDLFARYANDAFWEDPANLPPTTQIV
jgi:sulfotransferase